MIPVCEAQFSRAANRGLNLTGVRAGHEMRLQPWLPAQLARAPARYLAGCWNSLSFSFEMTILQTCFPAARD
jgi:hypothetical protein